MKKSQLFAMAGFLIGWGAPSGAMGLRFLTKGSPLSLLEFVGREWDANSFFYWYMLMGTCLVLTVVGYLLGRNEDREAERHRERIGS